MNEWLIILWWVLANIVIMSCIIALLSHLLKSPLSFGKCLAYGFGYSVIVELLQRFLWMLFPYSWYFPIISMLIWWIVMYLQWVIMKDSEKMNFKLIIASLFLMYVITWLIWLAIWVIFVPDVAV